MDEELIPSDAVKAIQDSVVTEPIQIGEHTFVTRPVFTTPPQDEIESLQTHTLKSLVEYVQSKHDEPINGLAIHVVNPTEVQLISKVFGEHRQRETFLVAKCETLFGKSFSFGNYYSAEDFNVALQSLFVDDHDIDNVLRIVGNIKEEQVRNTSDDGVTQTVVARAGIARVEDVEVPNPVTLAPYRTFREIKQPASAFILRLKTGPQCALFEADGAAWKLEAIASIARYLTEELTDIPIFA